MDISLKDLKEILLEREQNSFAPWLGKKVFIRSVSHHYTGFVKELIPPQSAMLIDAAWIPDDGRFSDAMKSGEFSEVEPYSGPVQVNYGAVLDVTEIPKLPTVQK